MAARVSVTHEDIMNLEEQIRRKETKLPGSKLSLKKRGSNHSGVGGGGSSGDYSKHIEMKTAKNSNLPSITK